MPDHPAAKLYRPGTVPAGTVPGETVRPGWCPRLAPDQHHHRPGQPRRPAPPRRQRGKARAAAHTPRRLPWLFFCPLPAPAPISTAAAPISTGKDRAAHGDGLPDLPGLGGDGLPDLPGLGGDGLPDEQRTARPITCPGCSFPLDTAAAPMKPPPCCPHPCQTYRQRQPPARQHPAASPTPEGSDSPPNGIWL